MGDSMTIQSRAERGALPEPSILLRTDEASRIQLSPDAANNGSCSNAPVYRLGVGIAAIILPPATRITRKDCVRARTELLELTGGKPGSVLLQIAGIGSVDRDAISAYSEEPTITALAILGSTPVDRVIAQRMVRRGTPTCPIKYFTDEEEAIIWLPTIGIPGNGFPMLSRTRGLTAASGAAVAR